MTTKKFPEEYTRRGRVRLHSGGVTDTFYDVNVMLTDEKYLREITENIPVCDCYVGIATGGAIIASQFVNFAMIKDDELKGKVDGDYCLIDDVVTTESSIMSAIAIVGRPPKHIFVVVDRRGKKFIQIKSMFEGDCV